ncbi:hypothetical protein [Marinifilum sp.]|uniref:hypothetical protein n=1 Tax=Marinifilum sp. TaxID=2033137 RepID=UPI003BA8A854
MKKLKLIMASLFLLIGSNVMAQNGTNPFVGSTHTYEVTRGVAGSTLLWSVLNADESAADVADFSIAANGGETVDITWNTLNGGTNANYIVQLSETAPAASGGCITLRQFVVTVIGNAFDIVIADLPADCSDASGSVIVNSGNNNLGTTSKTFTIDMSTQADMTSASYIPDWEFDYEVTSTNGDLVSVTFDTNTNDPSQALSGKSATGKVTVNNNDYSVQLKVEFNNTWASGDLLTVTLSNGIELTYNTPENLDTNNTGSVTINAMPATTNITTD